MKRKLILILAALMLATFAVGALAVYARPIPAVVPAQSKDDFIGAWRLCGASTPDGLYFSANELDLSGDPSFLEAEGLSGDLEIIDDEMTFSFSINTGWSYWRLLKDGTLAYTIPDGSSEGIPSLFCLREDGTISTDMYFWIENGEGDSESTDLTVYFERVPQA